jgi:hypothetical protein
VPVKKLSIVDLYRLNLFGIFAFACPGECVYAKLEALFVLRSQRRIAMKPNTPDWNLVLAGSWNVAILNPDWLGKNVFNTNEFGAEMVIEGVFPRLRFHFDKVLVIPAMDRVIFAARRPEDGDLLAVEEAAKRVLTLLPVTPVSGVGINLGYAEDNPSPDLTSLFAIGDNGKVSDEGLEINSTSIVRELKFEDRVVNFRITQSTNVSFNFNYHKNVANAEEALQAITNKVKPFRDYSEALLTKLYGLELEEANGHQI